MHDSHNLTGDKTNNSDQRSTTTNTATYNTQNYEYSMDADVANNAIGMAQKVTDHAYDYADNVFSSAVDFANKNDDRAMTAFDRAANIVSSNAEMIKAAYADAKGTTDAQKQIVLAVVGMAGLVVVATMIKRRAS